MKDRRKHSRFHLDSLLLFICTSLLVVGYITVVSSSLHLGEKLANNSLHYPVRQLFHIVLGVIVAMVLTTVPLKLWEKSGSWLFILGLALLVFVLVPGIGVKVKW